MVHKSGTPEVTVPTQITEYNIFPEGLPPKTRRVEYRKTVPYRVVLPGTFYDRGTRT